MNHVLGAREKILFRRLGAVRFHSGQPWKYQISLWELRRGPRYQQCMFLLGQFRTTNNLELFGEPENRHLRKSTRSPKDHFYPTVGELQFGYAMICNYSIYDRS